MAGGNPLGGVQLNQPGAGAAQTGVMPGGGAPLVHSQPGGAQTMPVNGGAGAQPAAQRLGYSVTPAPPAPSSGMDAIGASLGGGGYGRPPMAGGGADLSRIGASLGLGGNTGGINPAILAAIQRLHAGGAMGGGAPTPGGGPMPMPPVSMGPSPPVASVAQGQMPMPPQISPGGMGGANFAGGGGLLGLLGKPPPGQIQNPGSTY